MPRSSNGLTPKQQRFVEEYQVDHNATQAAIRAGYSPRTADRIGSENLHKLEIAQAISKERTKVSEKTGLTAQWVEEQLIEIVQRCMQHKKVLNKAGQPTGRYTFDAAGANRALELLGKRLRMFVDKIATTNENGDGTAPLSTLPTELILALAARIRQRQADESKEIE